MKHANSNILFFLKPKAETAYIYDYHTVRQALEIMEYHKYSSIPILNREGKYVGSITEGDLLWGLKKLDLFNIKDAENISIMKIDRHHHQKRYHRLLLQRDDQTGGGAG